MALVPELVAHAHSEVHNTLHLLYALDCVNNKEEKILSICLERLYNSLLARKKCFFYQTVNVPERLFTDWIIHY